MKKYIYQTFVFIFNAFLLMSGIIVVSILFDKLFYSTKEMVVTPNRFIYSSIGGLIGATYFLLSGKKKIE